MGSVHNWPCTKRSPQLGKQPRVAIASKLPPRYLFLDPDRKVIEDFKPANFADRDCVVVLDTGTWNQLGDFGDWLKASTLPRAVVDHHRTQDDLGGLQFVDIAAESTGRLAHEIIRALGAKIGASVGESPVHGGRDRHRLVPAPERDAANVRARGRVGRGRGKPDAALRAAVRVGPARALAVDRRRDWNGYRCAAAGRSRSRRSI